MGIAPLRSTVVSAFKCIRRLNDTSRRATVSTFACMRRFRGVITLDVIAVIHATPITVSSIRTPVSGKIIKRRVGQFQGPLESLPTPCTPPPLHFLTTNPHLPSTMVRISGPPKQNPITLSSGFCHLCHWKYHWHHRERYRECYHDHRQCYCHGG